MSEVVVETIVEVVPEGYEQLPTGLGFTDVLQPCYRQVNSADGADNDNDNASFGLIISSHHANTMGMCHGGVLMTLADITAATGANMAKGNIAGSPTVNLSMDFISSSRLGEWLWAEAEQVSVKRLFGFCSGGIYNSKGVVARFSGTFYFPQHKGLWKNGTPGDGVMSASEK